MLKPLSDKLFEAQYMSTFEASFPFSLIFSILSVFQLDSSLVPLMDALITAAQDESTTILLVVGLGKFSLSIRPSSYLM